MTEHGTLGVSATLTLVGLAKGATGAFLGVFVASGLAVACGQTHKVTPHAVGGTDSASGGASSDTAGESAGGSEITPESCNDGPALAPARIWKLTDAQYVNAARQLFGVEVGPVITDSDPEAPEYTNFSELIRVNAVNAGQYQKAAKDVARQAIASHYDSFMPCGDTDECAEQFIGNRIARAFGHRLDATEVKRYLALFQKGAERSPRDGVRLMIEATLQSPSFLYRSELGPPTSGGPHGQVELTPTEIATLLALTLTNALPDDELWEKADTGALADPAVLSTQVSRLLDLPETEANLADSASYWLGVQRLRGAAKSPEQFPEFTATLKLNAYESARLFVSDVLTHGSVNDLVGSSKMYLNESLAALYGIAGVSGRQLRPINVTLPERSYGILSQPAVLAAFAKPTRTDPIHRGLFVFNALICAHGKFDPPANALAVAATFPADATQRELVMLRADNPQCATCHTRFDPLGLLSERYDAIGRYSEADADGPIDQSAVISSFGSELDGPTDGLAELSAKLLEGRRLADCVTQNLATVTLGRVDVAQDKSCALQDVKDRVAGSGQLRDFYTALATSPAFIKRDAQ